MGVHSITICPFLVSLEFEGKTLNALLKKPIDNQEKYLELAEEESDNNSDGDDVFYKTLRNYQYRKNNRNI